MQTRILLCFLGIIIASQVSLCSDPSFQGLEDLPSLFKESFVEKGRAIMEGLDGQLKLNYFDHFHDVDRDSERERSEFDLKLDFYRDFGDALNLNFSPRIRFDDVRWANGVIDELNERNKDRFILNIDEAYLTYSMDKLDISIGKKIYAWGTGDVFNPTDNINPIELTDIPTAEKIGVPSISLDYAAGAFDVQLIFVPLFSPSRLPQEDNRWIGDLSETSANFGNLNVVRSSRELPANTLENSQFAVRMTSSNLINGWDLSLSYYDGIDSIGVFRGEFVPPDIRISQVFQRVREIGADFSTTYDQLEIHAEASAHFTDGTEKDDDFYEYVAGVTYDLDIIPMELLNEIKLTVEYAGEKVFDEKTQGNEFSGTGEYVRVFKDSIIASLILKYSEDIKLTLPGVVNLGDDDYYLAPVLTMKIRDNTEIELGFDIFSGDLDTFLGKWTKNDRFFCNLTQSF